MGAAFHIVPILELPIAVEELCAEATGEGFRFVNKLAAEWHAGKNRFKGVGEACLGAFQAAELVGICGLNRDPYLNQSGVGRLRHLYVRRSARRLGVGSSLVRQLLATAENVFHLIRLRTETEDAAAFYLRLGFSTVQEDAATHALWLRRS